MHLGKLINLMRSLLDGVLNRNKFMKIINEKEWQFQDRFLVEDGTIYVSRLGDTIEITQEFVMETDSKIKSLIGQRVKINGVESKVLKAEVTNGSGYPARTYWVAVLTDEEVLKK